MSHLNALEGQEAALLVDVHGGVHQGGAAVERLRHRQEVVAAHTEVGPVVGACCADSLVWLSLKQKSTLISFSSFVFYVESDILLKRGKG